MFVLVAFFAVLGLAKKKVDVADRYLKTRTLPPKKPVPTPLPEASAEFTFTFVPDEFADEDCPACPKCEPCPGCPSCQSCPKCPPPPKCDNCRPCPTPCPPCEKCEPCPKGKIDQSESINGASGRVLFYEVM